MVGAASKMFNLTKWILLDKKDDNREGEGLNIDNLETKYRVRHMYLDDF